MKIYHATPSARVRRRRLLLDVLEGIAAFGILVLLLGEILVLGILFSPAP